jgi:hypothetical protein
MKKKELDEWLLVLAKMTPKEIHQVRMRLKLLTEDVGSRKKTVADISSSALLFWEVIVEQAAPVISVPRTITALPAKDIERLETNLKDHKQYLHRAFGKLSRRERIVAYRVIVRLVIDELRLREVPLSPRSIISQTKNIPGILDKNFPGYAHMGILGNSIRRKRRHNAK